MNWVLAALGSSAYVRTYSHSPFVCKQHACIATLRSIKFTLRKTRHTCIVPARARDQSRSILYIIIFFFSIKRRILIRCVSFAPFFSSSAFLHFAQQIVFENFCSARRHTDGQHSSSCDDQCWTYSVDILSFISV